MRMIALFTMLLIAQEHHVCHAQWTHDTATEGHLQRGIAYVYNLSFDSATVEFHEIVRLKPDHPVGYFFLATIEWWRIAIDLDNTGNDDRFYSLLDKVVELCEKRLKNNDHDLAALFFKGGALGFQARLHATRSDWVKAAAAGHGAFSVVQEAYHLAPDDTDILLGIGIYNYYAETIPDKYPVVKPLMMFFPKGDKRKGIDQLRTAAERARYAKVEAEYFLLQIFANHENRFEEGLAVATKLHAQFPRNVIFHKFLGRCYGSLSRMAEMQRTYNEVLQRVHEKGVGYNNNVEREAEYYLGQGDMSRGEYGSALRHFYHCDELSRTLDQEEASGFMVITNLRIGMVYDVLSKREDAIKQYNKVLKMSDYMDAHDQARRYLSVPYVKS